LFSWLTLRGRVAWRRTQGHERDGARNGVGVEFLFDDESQRRRMARLLVNVRERLGREVRVVPPRPTTTTPTSAPPTTSIPPHRSSMLPRK
jgi:hypothetical protein